MQPSFLLRSPIWYSAVTTATATFFLTNIAEKYKITILEDHNQERKRKIKKKTTKCDWLDWTSTRPHLSTQATSPASWIGTSTRHTTQQQYLTGWIGTSTHATQ